MIEVEYEQGAPGRADGFSDKSDIYIDVKAYGGADIANVCRDMVDLANRLGITVWASLNGVRTLARPGDDPTALFRQWDRASSSSRPYKYAST